MATDDIDIRVAVRNARAAVSDLDRLTRETKGLGTQADRTGRKGVVAGRRLNSMGKASRFAGSRMRSAVGSAIALAGAYIGIAKAREAITTTEELAKSTLGLKKATGLETEQASRWVNVAKVRGVQSKALMMAFGTLSRNMTAATEAGSTQADTFKKLGVSHEVLRRGNMQEVLGGMAQGFKDLGETPERTAAGMTLMGRGWQSLLPIMRDGKKGMNDLLGASDEMGATMSDKTVEQMMELVTAQRELQLGTLGLKVAFTKAVTPALTDMAETARDAIKVMNDPSLTSEEKVAKITSMFTNMGGRITSGLRDAHIGEALGDAVEEGFPRIAAAMGRGAGIGAKAFIKGWWDSDPATKMFVLGLLLGKMGLFSFLGKTAAKKFVIAFAPRLAAALGVEMAATGTIGASMLSKWPRLGTLAGLAFKATLIGAATYGLYQGLSGPFNQALEDLGLATDASDPTDGQAQASADAAAGRETPAQRHARLRRQRRLRNQGKLFPGANTITGGGGPRRGQRSLTSPSSPTARTGAVGPEIVVPVTLVLRDKVVGEAVGRAKLRDEALSGRRWGG